jgi:glycosyltransferase involved in cell wall biosynthesis
MRIGLVIQQSPELRRPPFDGPAEHVRCVASSLTNRGHVVRVVAGLEGRIWWSEDLDAFFPLNGTADPRGVLRRVEQAIRWPQRVFNLPYFNLFDSLRFSRACTDLLQGFDVVYERVSWMGYGGRRAARTIARPHVLEYNGDPLLDLAAKGIAPRGLQRRAATWGMSRVLRGAAHIVASGEGWRRQLIEAWDVPPGQISVVENGTLLLDLLDRAQLRCFQEEPPAGSQLDVIYLGGFLPWHGTEFLLRGLSAAILDGARLRLHMIGTGPALEGARRLALELDLQQAVQFHGHLSPEAFAPLLAASDIAVSPYCGWKEYSGLKMIDYKAAGLAIIATGEGGQPASIEHGRTGLIIPPCQSDALAQALRLLALDPILRRGMGRAARVEAERRHRWADAAAALEQLFRQTAAGGARDGE